ncbi:hypothetical protein M3Y96_00181900 [Aphelenchoides besseyi]|nr:hypothetical protein M3Y96_00181900 [Aphelenchoides besseyi]
MEKVHLIERFGNLIPIRFDQNIVRTVHTTVLARMLEPVGLLNRRLLLVSIIDKRFLFTLFGNFTHFLFSWKFKVKNEKKNRGDCRSAKRSEPRKRCQVSANGSRETLSCVSLSSSPTQRTTDSNARKLPNEHIEAKST